MLEIGDKVGLPTPFGIIAGTIDGFNHVGNPDVKVFADFVTPNETLKAGTILNVFLESPIPGLGWN